MRSLVDGPLLERLLTEEPGEFPPRLFYADRQALLHGDLRKVSARLRKRGRRVALVGSLLPAIHGASGVFLLLYATPPWLGVITGLFQIAMGLVFAVGLGH